MGLALMRPSAAKILELFWRRARKSGDRYWRLRLLHTAAKALSEVLSAAERDKARRQFERRKSRGRFYMAGWCWICHLRATVRHHIVPLAFGGTNQERNVVLLCDVCHRAVHTEELPGRAPRLTKTEARAYVSAVLVKAGFICDLNVKANEE